MAAWVTLAQVAASGAAPAAGAVTSAAGGAGANAGPLPAILFYLFAVMVLGAAVMVAAARNIVRAAAALLFALAGMAGFYFLLSAEFLAAVQLVVYVGGTLILVIFGVMLTSKAPGARYSPKRLEVVWALVTGALLTGGMLAAVLGGSFPMAVPGTAAAAHGYTIQALGRTLVDGNGYLVPFELVSVLLLAVMIGAAYLAKARRKGS